MSRLSDWFVDNYVDGRFRKMENRMKRLERDMAGKAEKAALDSLKTANDNLEAAFNDLAAFVQAEDENDASKINPEVTRADALTTKMRDMMGMTASPPGTVTNPDGSVTPIPDPEPNPSSPGEPDEVPDVEPDEAAAEEDTGETRSRRRK